MTMFEQTFGGQLLEASLFDEQPAGDDGEEVFEDVQEMDFFGEAANEFDEHVDQLRDILPDKRPAELQAALQATNGNVAEAADLLLSQAATGQASSVAIPAAARRLAPLFPGIVEVDAEEADPRGPDAPEAAFVEETVDDAEEGCPALVVACDGDLPESCQQMRGVYARQGSNHGKNLYVKLASFGQEEKPKRGKRAAAAAVEAYLYFWDDRDGDTSHGWWIGPDLGYTDGWASNLKDYHDGSSFPPMHGWAMSEEDPQAEPPDPPPGPGWQSYQDNGKIWYYYEGDEGNWWCCYGQKPQPYREEPARAATVRIQPYQATMSIMQAALPDCEPNFLQQRLNEKGDANEALEQIFASSTSYPRRAKRQCIRGTSSSSFQAEAQTGGASSSSSKPKPTQSTMDEKEEEAYWFGGGARQKYGAAYTTNARHLLLSEFSMLLKSGIDSVFDKHGAFAPAWKELHEAMQEKEKGKELPKCLRLRQAPGSKKRPSDQRYEPKGRLQVELKFVRKWAMKQKAACQANAAREAKRKQCERDGTGIECECCFTKAIPDEVVQCSAGHLFCFECVRRLVEVRLGEGEVLKVMCPSMQSCTEALPPSELRRALPEVLQEKLEKCMEESNIQALKHADGANLEKCPFCDFVILMDTSPEENKVFVCLKEECGKESCRLCKEENHIPLRCSEVERKTQTSHRTAVEERMSEALIRYCPPCKAKGINSAILKEDGCNKMTCPRSQCRAFFCYMCNEEIPRKVGYGHFCQHPTSPGKPCTKCQKCLLWSSKDFDAKEAKRVVEAGRQFHQEYVSEHQDAELAEDLDILKNGGSAHAPPPAPPPKAGAPARRRRGWFGW